MRRQSFATGVVVVAWVMLLGAGARAGLLEDFDGGGTTPYTLTNSTGTAASVVAGGPTGSFLRIGNLTGSNNNSVAFDEEPTQTGAAPDGIQLSFDFRMSDDDANAAAGGCCGSAADGIGIGLFAAPRYGTSGGINPATGGAGDWERPAFADSLAIGLDVFQNIDQVSLNWADTELASADVQSFLDLNNNLFHRAIVQIRPDGDNSLLDMQIIEDVHGSMTVHDIFSDAPVPGLDLNDLPGYRLIAGARTGGAFVNGDLDNIQMAAIPEPSGCVLFVLGSLLMLVRARRG